jgi:mono/diheme cytochrome c family protein
MLWWGFPEEAEECVPTLDMMGTNHRSQALANWEDTMRNAWIAMLVLAGAAQTGLAAGELTGQLQLGRRLFEQSCGVCHTRPTLVAGMYGPELSKESAGGREDVMRDLIANGTPRMPGFKYTYSPDQIAAIAAYLKTLQLGSQSLPAPPSTPPAIPVR